MEVGVKTHEVPRFPVLLGQVQAPGGVVIIAGALYVQRSHAHYLQERGAEYLVTMMGNEPSLYEQLKSLSWNRVPAGAWDREQTQGKVTISTPKAVTIEAGIDFPTQPK